MLLENGIKKNKKTSEGYKEMLGLLGLIGTIIIIRKRKMRTRKGNEETIAADLTIANVAEC